ncbi:hypothetical protein EMIHUDRAFT_226411 [Emiliania huxleyi CCMP1516]|uniref:Uncharacterized protein n=2 Tax=Emiliania huxleyi TaxID=2903 RepID=A0A0D3KKU8_EMIH1|nr:hypothetical protein EMIHUDRAFT_226411 [Emiliania huxleyi CCMP1516]EOD36383.1 hypothetical protein EMIHUDRAFT_226411 [Emiliania huxleyi CCMP1516]|eukprot:XP_005788812.1 hypothetical protein EMIHUDRAFT_226411 [Emiliania huxleyi CCMP1516]
MLKLILSLLSPAAAVRLVTTTSLPAVSPERAIRFLSTPSNWPIIVLSSWAVRGTDIDRPLAPGEAVDEIFGLPPLLPLEVSWTCTSIGESTAVFDSPSGLAGVAENCQMDFVAEKDGAGGSLLRFAMSYEPLSPLANAARPASPRLDFHAPELVDSATLAFAWAAATWCVAWPHYRKWEEKPLDGRSHLGVSSKK